MDLPVSITKKKLIIKNKIENERIKDDKLIINSFIHTHAYVYICIFILVLCGAG